MSLEATARALNVDPAAGLTSAEAESLRARFGLNQLAEQKPASRWVKFLAQFNEVVIWVLLAAAIISGCLGEWTDAIAIVAIVLINGLLGFLQEERAGEALAALKKMSAPQARVRRDGNVVMLPAGQLLPGDRVELESGDFIPADVRLITTTVFRMDESALTGESSPVDKDAGIILPEKTDLAARRNMAYMGTVISAGRASALVVNIGMQTELGKIAGLLQEHKSEPTPLQKRLADLGRLLVYLCLGIVAIIFALQVLRGSPLHEAFLLAVSLAVAAVPEGLPAVVTIALALGLQRMAKRHALIRRLPSVETLGSVTVICSDKTGTLTKNEMTVREVYAGGKRYSVTGGGYEPVGEVKEVGETGGKRPQRADARTSRGADCETGSDAGFDVSRITGVPPVQPERSEKPPAFSSNENCLHTGTAETAVIRDAFTAVPPAFSSNDDCRQKDTAETSVIRGEAQADHSATLPLPVALVSSPATNSALTTQHSALPPSLSAQHAALRQTLTIGALCNSARIFRADGDANWHLTGDPTEGALIVAAMKAGINDANQEHQWLYEIPFDSDRKLMTVLALTADGTSVFYTKGAPEVLLARCTHQLHESDSRPLTDERRAEILSANADMASRALRVLAMASRDGTNVPPETGVECDMTFAGLVGMFDPPRQEVRSAVARCIGAGIRPVMITGDHPSTALAIARELGIADEQTSAIAGAALDEMDEQALNGSVGGASVFARVTAEHKLRVVRALQANGHVVAMTGDGVNDAPAVKSADIGIAMGKSGTDVTRQAADMVLTDDNFASIVSAIEEGRGVFDDIRKVVHYLLGCNTGEVLFMFIGALAGWQSPLKAIQILWINLVTDALPALALGIEPPEHDAMRRPPRPPGEGVITRPRGLRMLFHGTLIAGATLAGFMLMLWLHPKDDRHVIARTVAFCILSYSQLFYSFSCRSDKYTLPQLGFFSNKGLIGAIILSGLIQTAVFLPHVSHIFHVTTLSWEWGVVLGLSLLPVTIIEVIKLLRAKDGM
jgi:magnesium-transporting ATPase (P-type)